MNPPEGMPGRTRPGEATALLHPFGRDGLRLEKIRATSGTGSPLFFGHGPVERGLKSSYGMLNVLPPVVPVKRIPLHMVA